jgi:pimeloyl-ACP methyl ester carboxylesterase
VPYVTIENNRYYYRASKKAENKIHAAVLIHGSGGDSSVWENQMTGLGMFCRLIVPDLPGHGRSNGNVLATAKGYAEWLEKFNAALKLSSFSLIGHSLGGAIAQEYVRAYPEKVRSLILTGTGNKFVVLKEYLQLLQDDFEAAVKTSCINAYSVSVSRGLYQKGYEMLMRNGKKTLYSDMLTSAQFDSSPWVSSIFVPTLVVCGSDDKIMPRELSRELSSCFPKSKLHIVSGSGHMVMVEAPDEFNNTVKWFIDSQGGSV